MQKTFPIIGLMSGSSLDGIDLTCALFWIDSGIWHYRITHTGCVSYPPEWRKQLEGAFYKSAYEISILDQEYGVYLGQTVKRFIDDNSLEPLLVASHGHTIFHRPEEGITIQVGEGSRLAAITGVPVVNDFRSEDVRKGGQGAPLVPVGDKLLFADYGACVNIGGIANVSFDSSEGQRIAFDICPANQVLDQLAARLGHSYDPEGTLARNGRICELLFQKLNNLDYYNKNGPKSLGREWVEAVVMPVITASVLPVGDLLRTFTEHIAVQIGHSMAAVPQSSVLVSGGGAHNLFLVERIRERTKHKLVIPDSLLVDFKEALVFGFLGLLRWLGEINVYKSVTGAQSDSCSGKIHLP
jgi:anhydro-N-acetylmuramic acid kinase